MIAAVIPVPTLVAKVGPRSLPIRRRNGSTTVRHAICLARQLTALADLDSCATWLVWFRRRSGPERYSHVLRLGGRLSVAILLAHKTS